MALRESRWGYNKQLHFTTGFERATSRAGHDEEVGALDEIVSDAPSSLPPEIRNIIRENSVSAKAWKGLQPNEKADLKRNIQKKIQDYYLNSPKKMVNRKSEK